MRRRDLLVHPLLLCGALTGNAGATDVAPLFVPPTAAELAAVRSEWSARSIDAVDWQVHEDFVNGR